LIHVKPETPYAEYRLTLSTLAVVRHAFDVHGLAIPSVLLVRCRVSPRNALLLKLPICLLKDATRILVNMISVRRPGVLGISGIVGALFCLWILGKTDLPISFFAISLGLNAATIDEM
jgi:hypothetical protein